MTRPCKPLEELRRHQLHVRVSADEFKKINSKAANSRLSTSTFMRDVCLGYKIKSKVDQEAVYCIMKLNARLGTIGGLLKQYLGTHASADRQEVKSALNDLMETKNQASAQISELLAAFKK